MQREIGGIRTFNEVFPFKKRRKNWLAKAKEDIAAGAVGKVEASDVGGALSGGDFNAYNLGLVDVTSGDFVHLGEDETGNAFFRPGGGASIPPVVCDCSGATTFEECWDMGWSQFDPGLGQGLEAGSFKTRASWQLLNNGFPVVGCEALAKLINGCTPPGDPAPNLSWQVDLLTEGVFNSVPYSFASGPQFLDCYSFIEDPCNMLSPQLFIPTPWGESIDINMAANCPFPGGQVFFPGCSNTLDNLTIFTQTRIATGDPCEFWDGISPCVPGDPRPNCATCNP